MVIPITLAKNNEDMYLFSPYDVERVYGVPFADVSVTEKYYEMVDDARIRKPKIKAREFFQTLAELQFESGYPYIMYEDTVNRANPIEGKITHSNLCSEILQVSTPSQFNEDLSYSKVGKDISCNLGSLNIAKAMDSPDFAQTIEVAIRALTAVSDQTHITSVPSIEQGNNELPRDRPGPDEPARLPGPRAHPLRLRRGRRLHQHLLLHGALPRAAGVEPDRDRARARASAASRESKYASGRVLRQVHRPGVGAETERVRELFARRYSHSDPGGLAAAEGVGADARHLQPEPAGRAADRIDLLHQPLDESIHPIASKIEIRKEGKIGRVYYPAPYLTNDNLEYYQDAYEIGYEKIIDTYAAATQHVDQGLSLTLFFKDTATTRDVNKAQIYAWRKGIKTLYYIRLRQMALEGTEVEGCVVLHVVGVSRQGAGQGILLGECFCIWDLHGNLIATIFDSPDRAHHEIETLPMRCLNHPGFHAHSVTGVPPSLVAAC